ncbi:MAG: hypothetical protein ACTSQD_05830, partial [Promethearchaeota archaeon]
EISFKLFFDSPEKANLFIDKTIKNKILVKDDNENLSLSQNLKKNLQSWQIKRRKTIVNKIINRNDETSVKNNKIFENDSNYNTLLKAFLDKGTINRAAILSDENFNINEFDHKNGIIRAEVVGVKESSYNIEINTKNKTLVHSCHDFQERRAADKKFCKHLAKLFLILKDKDSVSALNFLREIAENINEYKFLS